MNFFLSFLEHISNFECCHPLSLGDWFLFQISFSIPHLYIDKIAIYVKKHRVWEGTTVRRQKLALPIEIDHFWAYPTGGRMKVEHKHGI